MSADSPSVDDYLDLVTSEYRQQPKFISMLTILAQWAVDRRILLAGLRTVSFDLDTAFGAQLDVVGQWVGLSRTLSVPVSGVYFAFNTPGLGFNQGVWFNSSDPSDGVITMDDATYRLMLRAKIAANTWDGSLGDANTKLASIFQGGSVQITDNFDMTQTITIDGTAPSALFEELVNQGYIQLKPAGVESL